MTIPLFQHVIAHFPYFITKGVRYIIFMHPYFPTLRNNFLGKEHHAIRGHLTFVLIHFDHQQYHCSVQTSRVGG
jgi:hypothetical protein